MPNAIEDKTATEPVLSKAAYQARFKVHPLTASLEAAENMIASVTATIHFLDANILDALLYLHSKSRCPCQPFAALLAHRQELLVQK